MLGRSALQLAVLVVGVTGGLAACTEGKRGEGEPCEEHCKDWFSCTWYCDDGLVCNRGVSPYACQRPGSVPAGGACNPWEIGSSLALCAEGLGCVANGPTTGTVFKEGSVPTWRCEPLSSLCGVDTGAPNSACPQEDSGARGAPDVGVPDSGAPDLGALDSGVPDWQQG